MKNKKLSVILLSVLLDIVSLTYMNAQQQTSVQTLSTEQQIKRNLVGRTIIEPTRKLYREKFDIKSIDNILNVEIVNKNNQNNDLVYQCRLKLSDHINTYIADVVITYAWNGKTWLFQYLQSKRLDIVSTGKFQSCIMEKKEPGVFFTEEWFLYNNCDVTLIVEGKIFTGNSNGTAREWQYFALEVPANDKALLSYDSSADFTIERVERP